MDLNKVANVNIIKLLHANTNNMGTVAQNVKTQSYSLILVAFSIKFNSQLHVFSIETIASPDSLFCSMVLSHL